MVGCSSTATNSTPQIHLSSLRPTRLASGWQSARIDTTSGGKVTALSCTTGACMAVDGNNHQSWIWNGTDWTGPTSVDTSANVTGVSCVTAQFCQAVDDHGGAVQWNGSSWSAPQQIDSLRVNKSSAVMGNSDATLMADVTPTMTAVSCGTVDFCVGVDAQGQEVTWSQQGWGQPVPIESSDVPLVAISCTFEPSCVAVDGNGNAFNGSTNEIRAAQGQPLSWLPAQAADAAGSPTSISCPNPYDCVVVDSHGDVVTWKPGAWSAPQSIDPGKSLSSVSCSSATACTAADSAGNQMTWNGSTWSAPTVTGATTASCSGSTCTTANTTGDAMVGPS
jgi:hypothetical protein